MLCTSVVDKNYNPLCPVNHSGSTKTDIIPELLEGLKCNFEY
jgi:hypothetical protein